MKKLRLFFENFLVYGLGGIISKVIPLLMLPIITRLMPNTEYYGISDLCTTIISVGQAFSLLGMYDAMYRMYFEKEQKKYQKEVCSTTLLITMGASIIVIIILLASKDLLAKYIFGGIQYRCIVDIAGVSVFFSTIYRIVSAPTRMQNKRNVFLIFSAIVPIISYSISIILLLKGYYVVALPLATAVISVIQAMAFGIMNRSWFSVHSVQWMHLKPLLRMALPFLANYLIYWVFNYSDKLMITQMLGAGSSGVYAVGSKLGYASQLIYTAFAGGWQYFAFSTMKEDGQVKTNSLVFEYLGTISFACAAFVFVFSEPIYKLLFEGDYVAGYIVAPYLFLAPLLQMLFQVACNQFLVIKKTWPNIFILLFGAILNVLLNFMLIPRLGIEGAAIATLVGYIVSVFVGVIVLCKMKLMIISKRFLVVYLCGFLFFIIWRLILIESTAKSTLFAIGVLITYILLYRKDIASLGQMIKNKK